MEAAVVDTGSKLLKAGPAIPDQAPSLVITQFLQNILFNAAKIQAFGLKIVIMYIIV